MGGRQSVMLTPEQANQLKDILKMQIMSLKDERLSDEDITFRLRTFFGFSASLKPIMLIQTVDQLETTEFSPPFVDLELNLELAAKIHSLYLQHGFNYEEIRERLSEFKAYLRKLDEENEQKLAQAKEVASLAKKKQKKQKGNKPPSAQVLPRSMMTSSSTSALPPMLQTSQMELGAILRRGSQDGFPYSPINAVEEQKVKSPKRRASFGSMSFDVGGSPSQDGAETIPSSHSYAKKLLSPMNTNDSDGDSLYRIKRKAPLPWRQQKSQTGDEIPVTGFFSKDSRDIGSLDQSSVSGNYESTTISYYQLLFLMRYIVNAGALKSSFDAGIVASQELQPPLFCGVCGMSFKTSGSLDRHLNFSVCIIRLLRHFGA